MSNLMRIMNEDTIDLIALRFVLREAELRVRETGPCDLEPSVQEAQDRAFDRRAANVAGGNAARDCLRFDGETPAASEFRPAKSRCYSMYAMHPDTAEQVIKALEALIESVGPRYRIPTRARHYTANATRNPPQQEAKDK